MSSLVEHGKEELRRIGLDPKSDDMNGMMARNVIELLEVFSKQGHSGGSAPYCINTFSVLAKFSILSPLTGDDEEWRDVSGYSKDKKPMYQNIRYSSVFKDPDGTCYDIDGIIFEDEDGNRFTNSESKVVIEFPYTPKKRVRKVPSKK